MEYIPSLISTIVQHRWCPKKPFSTGVGVLWAPLTGVILSFSVASAISTGVGVLLAPLTGVIPSFSVASAISTGVEVLLAPLTGVISLISVASAFSTGVGVLWAPLTGEIPSFLYLFSFFFFVASAISNGSGVLSILTVIQFDLFWLLPTWCCLGPRPGCW